MMMLRSSLLLTLVLKASSLEVTNPFHQEGVQDFLCSVEGAAGRLVRFVGSIGHLTVLYSQECQTRRTHAWLIRGFSIASLISLHSSHFTDHILPPPFFCCRPRYLRRFQGRRWIPMRVVLVADVWRVRFGIPGRGHETSHSGTLVRRRQRR